MSWFGSLRKPGTRFWTALLLGGILLCLPGLAGAETYTFIFEGITSNNSGNVAAGEAQLRMDVTSGSGPQDVTFAFYHAGNTQMSITDIYFYFNDPNEFWSKVSFKGFIENPTWDGNSGVKYKLFAWPAFLPGGVDNGLSRNLLVFSCDSFRPVVKTGVNPGESLGISFTFLDSKMNINDAVKALMGWISDKTLDQYDLAVGLHVQGFQGGGSESFVVSALVPLPPSLLFLGSGLLGLGLLGRRQRRKGGTGH